MTQRILNRVVSLFTRAVLRYFSAAVMIWTATFSGMATAACSDDMLQGAFAWEIWLDDGVDSGALVTGVVTFDGAGSATFDKIRAVYRDEEDPKLVALDKAYGVNGRYGVVADCAVWVLTDIVRRTNDKIGLELKVQGVLAGGWNDPQLFGTVITTNLDAADPADRGYQQHGRIDFRKVWFDAE